MKNKTGIFWGIALIAVGVIWGGNALGLFDIDFFFDGWWTLFIIVPCLAGLFTEKEKTGNLIGLLIGVLLLLACQDVIDFGVLWKLVVPAILILIGASMIFKNFFDKGVNEKIKKLNQNLNKEDEVAATFSGQNLNFAGEEFQGKTVNAIFGGVKMDLRKAKIKDEAVINASSIFGGIDILVPEDVTVKVKSNSIFGGVSNKVKTEGKKTIYLNAMCLFGGVEIK